MSAPEITRLIDAVADTSAAIIAYGETLVADAWRRDTACPGWSVQDHLSHVTDGMTIFLQRPRPDHQLSGDLPHAANPFTQFMEIGVDFRRSRPAAEVLEEFRIAAKELVDQLRSLPDEAFAENLVGPVNSSMPRQAFLGIAPVDWWFHEQDIRRATGGTVRVAGPGAEYALDQITSWIQAKLPTIVEAGTTVEVLVDPGRSIRAGGADEPHVRIRMPADQFGALVGGRGDIERLVNDPLIEIEGKDDVARDLMSQFVSTP